MLRSVRILGAVLAVRGLLAVAGACLLLITFAMDYSFANLNTYVMAYLRSKHSESEYTYADWIFVTATKPIVQGLCMPFGGEITRRYLGLRVSIVIGSIIYSVGYILTGLSVDYGLSLVVLTMGVSHGLGMALCYAQTIQAILKWFPGHHGFMGSFAIAGYGFGSVIWNPLQTAFVNPDNVSPTAAPGGGNKYFTDESVLSRVPGMFFLLGGVMLSIQIVASILIRAPTDEEVKEIAEFSTTSEKEDKQEAQVYSVRPTDVLRTREFYLIWVTFYTVALLNGFFNNYQKTFGQNYISDDRFFAIVSIVGNVINGSGRLGWGKLYDVKGYKFCVILICGVSSALCLSFFNLSSIPANSLGARFFYALWVCGIYAMCPGIYCCMAPVTMKAFGPEFYAANYGLLFTHNVLYSLTLILATKLLFPLIEYAGMFFLIGGMGILGMLATYVFPSNVDSEKHRARFMLMPCPD